MSLLARSLLLLSLGAPHAMPAMAEDNRLLLVDLREAYERSTALRQLLTEVDQALTEVAEQHESKTAPLREELTALRTSRMHEDEKRKRRASLLLALSEAEEAAQQQAQVIGAANEQAVAKVDATIAQIEEALKAEHGARAVLRAQEVLWFRSGAPFDVTEALYERLNRQLPKITLQP
ncbi:MAG: hypothetical protein MUE46_13980 [Xanthomonadales bacterium]|jgi:hypothetical protein|nr:hypothetical protein [Xanthomonadales bacterium]